MANPWFTVPGSIGQGNGLPTQCRGTWVRAQLLFKAVTFSVESNSSQ